MIKKNKKANIVVMPLFMLFVVILSVIVLTGITKVNSNQKEITFYRNEISLMSKIKLQQDQILNKRAESKLRQSIFNTFFYLGYDKIQTVINPQDNIRIYLIDSEKEIENAFDGERLKELFYLHIAEQLDNKEKLKNELNNNELILRNLDSKWFFSLVNNKYLIGKPIDNIYFNPRDINIYNHAEFFPLQNEESYNFINNPPPQKLTENEREEVASTFIKKLIYLQSYKKTPYNTPQKNIKIKERIKAIDNPFLIYPELKNICNEISAGGDQKLSLAQQTIRTVQISSKENPVHKACFGAIKDTAKETQKFVIGDDLFFYRPIVYIKLDTPFNETFDLVYLTSLSKDVMKLNEINQDSLNGIFEKLDLKNVNGLNEEQDTLELNLNKESNNNLDITYTTSPADNINTQNNQEDATIQQTQPKINQKQTYTYYFKKIKQEDNNKKEVEFEGCFNAETRKWGCNDNKWKLQDCGDLKTDKMNPEYLYVCVVNNKEIKNLDNDKEHYAMRFALKLGTYKLGEIKDFSIENAPSTQQTAKITFKVEDGTIHGIFIKYYEGEKEDIKEDELKESQIFNKILPIGEYKFLNPEYVSNSDFQGNFLGTITYKEFPLNEDGTGFKYNVLYRLKDNQYTLFFHNEKLETNKKYTFAIMPFIEKENEKILIREGEEEPQILMDTVIIKDNIPPTLWEVESKIELEDTNKKLMLNFCEPDTILNLDGQTQAEDIESYVLKYSLYNSSNDCNKEELLDKTDKLYSTIEEHSFAIVLDDEDFENISNKKICYLIYPKDLEENNIIDLFNSNGYTKEDVKAFIIEKDLSEIYSPSWPLETLSCN